MLRRVTAGAVIVCVLALGVASATSLGVFVAPIASGLTQQIEPCAVDSVELLDASGVAIPLSAPGPYTVAGVRLTGLDDSCAGMTPVVVVIGQDPWLLSSNAVLAVQQLPALDPLDASAGAIDIDVTTGDLVDLVLDVTTVVTELRMGFCPAGATCT